MNNMFQVSSFKFQDNKGFSLLGVIAAFFIITVGMVGILGLANTTIKGSSLSKMRLIASGLAQEGVEVVRNMRADTDWTVWHSGVSDGDYIIQYDSPNLIPFEEKPLRFNPSNGLYQYDFGNNSFFYRKVSLTKESNNEAKIVVEIKWKTKGQLHYLTVEDRLWNWR